MMFFGVRRDFALQVRFFKHYDVSWFLWGVCIGSALLQALWCFLVSVGILHCKCASSSTMMIFGVRRDFALQGCCFKHYDVFWCP